MVQLEWAAGFVELVVVATVDDIEPVVAKSVAVVVIIFHHQANSRVQVLEFSLQCPLVAIHFVAHKLFSHYRN